MKQTSGPPRTPAEPVLKDIRRATRRHSAEEKIRIVLEGLRGEDSIAELCRREGIAELDVLRLVQGVPGGRQEAARGRHGPGGHLGRGEGAAPRGQRPQGGLADLTLENRLLKKSMSGAGGDDA